MINVVVLTFPLIFTPIGTTVRVCVDTRATTSSTSGAKNLLTNLAQFTVNRYYI